VVGVGARVGGRPVVGVGAAVLVGSALGVMVGIGGALGALVPMSVGAHEMPMAHGTKKVEVSRSPKSPDPLAKTS
jgi:hypothetical protein